MYIHDYQILNCTSQKKTAPQSSSGLVDLSEIRPELHSKLLELLQFADLPDFELVLDRAESILEIAIQVRAKTILIGGYPPLMMAFGRIRLHGKKVVFAHSLREQHIGFVLSTL